MDGHLLNPPTMPAHANHDGSSALVPCTLFSGNYHFGVGALANSLHRHGFRGTMCVGYNPPLPPWSVATQREDEDTIFEVSSDFRMRFIPWPTKRNLSLEKPRFLLHVLDTLFPQSEGVLFFDADITIHGAWTFFEAWLRQGIALCLDLSYPLVPAGHPWRTGWRSLANESGYKECRDLEYYVNSGFVGVSRTQRATIQCWAALIDTFLLSQECNAASVKFATRENPFVGDQDMLNAALMATSAPLSIIGQEGMDFTCSGYTMSHATDDAKPWNKRFIQRALAGYPPGAADKTYWHYADHPIRLFTPQHIARTQLAIKMASAIGRIYRRS